MWEVNWGLKKKFEYNLNKKKSNFRDNFSILSVWDRIFLNVGKSSTDLFQTRTF